MDIYRGVVLYLSHVRTELYLSHINTMGWLRLVGSLKSIGLFCKRALQKRPTFCKETHNFKEPTNRSDPIVLHLSLVD